MNLSKEQGKSGKSERAYEKMLLREPTQSLKTHPPASIFDRPFRTYLREGFVAPRERRGTFNRFFSVKKFLCGAQK
jgi:hypothetical protein